MQLMVWACLVAIFLLDQFESTYLRFSLGLLAVSELLDVVWLFLNADGYWNPPEVGTSAVGQRGYLRFILFLTFLGVFLKIPLGVFLFHFRRLEAHKVYRLDLGFAKLKLEGERPNPISVGLSALSVS